MISTNDKRQTTIGLATFAVIPVCRMSNVVCRRLEGAF